ncbi:M23 family metallopeptidase [Microbacterium sp. zg.Y1090]|uniref:M23 family metallopeptidase n=1 Tax=Microbacterium wangruii TaxID=3049073 RepID=UPI00214DE4BE|nr:MULTISPECIES: M23 family metallopeptidase [unclassified Microbacterium]MCR2819215.1 M23 family metallopeptidase [Microbacterium sp. zg.Y1090]MDL5487124.1 M23 family metallopeptidase [Microbacterium sp. zg-Y1211]WIM28198.1 M23 family metallopeptidase [Microbacterium sp. zg-Y1090]
MTSRRVFRLAIPLIAAGAVLVVGCSAAALPDATNAPPVEVSAAGVTVPDAFTAVTVATIGAPPLPFPGTDGRLHVVYDLQLTNATQVPATVDRIDVVDGADPERTIASFSGAALVDPSCTFGECNRLRGLPAGYIDSAVIPPQTSRVVFIDFTVDSLDSLPPVLLHRIAGTGALSPAFGEPGAMEYLATPLAISRRALPVIAPPVRGDDWIALNGCCEPGFPHRSSVMSVNGKLNNSQRFAIDWKRTNAAGAFYSGDKTSNDSYIDYGADILAVADGTVVSILDGMAANAPGVLPAHDPELAAKLTVENVDGNHVVLDIGDGVYAMYAHLIAGSVTVEIGDTVTAGQVLGHLGNTGNANASHLHFQLMDGPSLLDSDSLPYALTGFDYGGQVAPELIADADDYLTGTFLQGALPRPEARTRQLPLGFAIVDFP